MSKDKPEVGDVWKNKQNGRPYLVTGVGNIVIGIMSKGLFQQTVSPERFIKDFTYLGKAKARINDLFEVEE